MTPEEVEVVIDDALSCCESQDCKRCPLDVLRVSRNVHSCSRYIMALVAHADWSKHGIKPNGDLVRLKAWYL